jgi:3-phenylpropionate/trans-cinnamate dioxygenase ferredoxin component
MEFVKVARAGDLAPGAARRVEHGGTAILLTNIDGHVSAISDTCSHRGGTLSKGTIDGAVVTCPRHGSRFDVRTGKNLAGPKILGIRGKTGDVSSYRVKVEDDDILVELEDELGRAAG